jgi:hypothetical protein
MYIVIFSLKIKPLQYERGGDFVVKQYFIFSIFFCLVMCHESQTSSTMAIKIL